MNNFVGASFTLERRLLDTVEVRTDFNAIIVELGSNGLRGNNRQGRNTNWQAGTRLNRSGDQELGDNQPMI